MINLRRISVVLVMASIAVMTAFCAPRKWEAVQTRAHASTAVELSETETFDVWTSDGYLYVSTNRPVSVKVFTILGQSVSEQSLNSGTWRLPVRQRGIYVLKIGTATRRITI